MAMRKRVGRKRKGRRRGGVTNKILGGIKSYKKVMGALGLRKGAASLGKLAVGTGLRMARTRAAMMV
jgi:hypothetical protein